MPTPDQQREIREIWTISDDALGIELLRRNAPDIFKRIADPIVLAPEVRTAGKPGPGSLELVKQAVADYLLETWTTMTEPFAVEFRKLVCVELKYCEKRLSGRLEREGVGLAMTIVDTIVTWYVKHPLPITWMTVWSLKVGVFDHLCKCYAEPKRR